MRLRHIISTLIIGAVSASITSFVLAPAADAAVSGGEIHTKTGVLLLKNSLGDTNWRFTHTESWDTVPDSYWKRGADMQSMRSRLTYVGELPRLLVAAPIAHIHVHITDGFGERTRDVDDTIDLRGANSLQSYVDLTGMNTFRWAWYATPSDPKGSWHPPTVRISVKFEFNNLRDKYGSLRWKLGGAL